MTVHNIQSVGSFKSTIAEHKVVLVDFFALRDSSCKAVAPVIAECSNDEKYKDFYFAKIDVDLLPALCDELHIRGQPTLQLYKDGEKVAQVLEPSPESLTEFLDKGL
ncbi:Thioredoxin-2 [Cladobotryum mycophilum]|uniref:Thioredoxin-2 n=1 Tax=Cladobotryum mycophilum TaxID=491253 RepID=A0ABR0T1I5_9HYPO